MLSELIKHCNAFHMLIFFASENMLLNSQWLYVIAQYYHCVKSVRIRSFSGPHFPVFGLNNSE